MTFRIPANDICMSDAMPFQQHWEIRIPVPLTEVADLGDALHSRYSAIQQGDLLRICSYESKHFLQVKEVAHFTVIAKTSERLFTYQTGATDKIPDRVREAAVEKVPELKIVQFNKAFEVRDQKENVIDIFVDDAQAKAFIASGRGASAPPPPAAPPKQSDLRVEFNKRTKKHVVLNANSETVREFELESAAHEYVAKGG
jgi:hypothetical protein